MTEFKWRGLFSNSKPSPNPSTTADQAQQQQSSSSIVKSTNSQQVQTSSGLKYNKNDHILTKVFKYYYNYYKPTPQDMAGYKSGLFKYVVKPVGLLGLGGLGVVLLDLGYRKFHINEEAPSIFTINNKITLHQLLRNSDWLEVFIPEEDNKKKKERTPNRIREYIFNRKNKDTVVKKNDAVVTDQPIPIEHDYKKFYAKLDYKDPSNVNNNTTTMVENIHDDGGAADGSDNSDTTIITHIHVEKFHPFMKEGKGYWSTLIEYAMIRDRMGESNLALHLIKEQSETFGSKLWRRIFTNKEFEQYKESNIWLEKPWILNELSIDLDMEREYKVKSLKDYVENHENNSTIQQVLRATLNKQQDGGSTLLPDNNLLLQQNYYLYVSEEAFEEFKKSQTNSSNIRVVQKSAKNGDMFFVVGNKKSQSKDDISSLTFLTHKKEDDYIKELKNQEKKNHSPLWMRCAVIAASLGLAVSSIVL